MYSRSSSPHVSGQQSLSSAWRIMADVGNAFVHCKQHTPLLLHTSHDGGVRSSCHILIGDRTRIVSGNTQVVGDLKGQMAFMTGKLKVSGNMMLAMKMQSLFPPAK